VPEFYIVRKLVVHGESGAGERAPLLRCIDIAEQPDLRPLDEAGVDGAKDLPFSSVERGLDSVQRLTVVERAKRLLLPVGADRYQSCKSHGFRVVRQRLAKVIEITCRRDVSRSGVSSDGSGSVQRRIAQIFEIGRVQPRHVASDDQIPVENGISQRRVDTAQRTRVLKMVCHDADAEMTVSSGTPDDANVASHFFENGGRAQDQRLTFVHQERFVCSHTGTLAPGEHITPDASRRHVGMIALEVNARNRNTVLSKCFIIGVSMVAAMPQAHAGARAMTSVVRVDKRTGRLVRTMVPVARVSAATTRAANAPAQTTLLAPNINDLIEQSARAHEVEAPLIRSVIRAESAYNPLAVSNKGAQGLMQLIPSTARRFGVKDSFDSQDNVEGGTRYLKYLIELFHGDYARAIAAYNAGEGAVTKYGGVPPYKETRAYVAQVAKHLAAEREAVASKIANSDLTSSPADTASKDIPVNASSSRDIEETYSTVIASVMPDGRVYYRTP
jgi:hypothetical protein